MRSLNTVQEERSKQALISTVPLVKLQLYSNRDAGTVGKTFYFSDRTVVYDYGNTGTDQRFDPWLDGLGDLESGLVHIADSSDSELIAKRFALTLRNALWRHDVAGVESDWRVIEILREDYAVEGGTIEVAQILVPKITTTGPLDLSAYTGDEHTVFYRGRISRLGPISEGEVQLQCETDAPEFTWGRATDASEVAPRDLGARYPRPYGSKSKLPLVARKVGWKTTLAVSLNDTETGVKAVTDGSGFPTSTTFYIWVEGERITCTDSSATTITISARGTDASVHNVGVVAIEEIDEAIFIVADDGAAPIVGVDALYVKNPFNGELVRVSSGYTFRASDETVDTDKTLSTITFTQAELRSLYEELYLAARMTVQPVYTSDTGASPTTSIVEPDGTPSYTWPVAGAEVGVWSEDAGHSDDPYWDYTLGEERSARDQAYSGALNNTDDVIRWRLMMSVQLDGAMAGPRYIRLYSGASNTFPIDTLDVLIPEIDAAINTGYGDWHYPGAGTKLNDLVGDSLRLFALDTEAGTGTQECWITQFGIQAEVDEETGSDITREVDGASIGLGLGYDLEMYADVQGTACPSLWDMVYDFESGSYSASPDCAAAASTSTFYEGAASLRVTLTRTTVAQCESADSTDKTAWTTNFCTGFDDSSDKVEGSACVRFTSTSASDMASARIDGSWAGVDLTADFKRFIVFNIKMKWNGGDGDVDFRAGVGVGHRYHWNFTDADFPEDTWKTVILDYENPDSSVGSPTPTAWDFFQVLFNYNGTQVSGMQCFIDNISHIPKLGRVQQNSISPTVDMSADETDWRFALKCREDAYNLLGAINVYFDNSSASGYTIPSPAMISSFPDTSFDYPAWAVGGAVSDSSGEADAVQTLGVSLWVEEQGVYPVATSTLGYLRVYVDRFEAKNRSSNPYSVAEGALLEKPADVIRHWVFDVGGKTPDETSFAAALTNLGSNKVAVDMRQLTPGGWREGAAGLGFHSRANVVPKETASGTVYCLYTAESDYDWPAADRIVTAWQTFGEAGPQGRELYTRLMAHYKYNAAVGLGSDESFESALRGDEDDNDLTVPSTLDFQNAADKYGSRSAPPFFFPGLEDDATAKDVFGYLCHEAIRAPRIFLLDGCPWWEVFDLEEDDLVQFTHPWSAVTIKARVLGYTKRFATEANSLRCLEVE